MTHPCCAEKGCCDGGKKDCCKDGPDHCTCKDCKCHGEHHAKSPHTLRTGAHEHHEGECKEKHEHH